MDGRIAATREPSAGLAAIESELRGLDANSEGLLSRLGRARPGTATGERLQRQVSRMIGLKAVLLNRATEMPAKGIQDIAAKARMAHASLLLNLEGEVVGMNEGLVLSIIEDLLRLR